MKKKGIILPHLRKNGREFSERDSAFRNMMVSVQNASEGRLPVSIIQFMERALSVDTKEKLLELHESRQLNMDELIASIIDEGKAAEYGSTVRVDEYVKRRLFGNKSGN